MIRINKYTRTATAYFDMDRWIHIRMDFLAALFVASLGLYIAYGPGHAGILASDVGFSLSMASTCPDFPIGVLKY